jgi:hypothetical protein
VKGYKTGGRKKGTPNALTAEIRERLGAVLSSEIEGLPALLQELQPDKRADIICRLASLLIPKPFGSVLGEIDGEEITVTMNLNPDGVPGEKSKGKGAA